MYITDNSDQEDDLEFIIEDEDDDVNEIQVNNMQQ